MNWKKRLFLCVFSIVCAAGCRAAEGVVSIQQSAGPVMEEKHPVTSYLPITTVEPIKSEVSEGKNEENTKPPKMPAQDAVIDQEMPQQPSTPVQHVAESQPQKKKVWVVDRPAWSQKIVEADAWREEVKTLIKPEEFKEVIKREEYDVTICNGCHKEFTGPRQVEDCVDYQVNVCGHSSYHTVTVPPEVEYQKIEAVWDIKYIDHPEKFRIEEHPEEGHWEYR